MSWNIFGDSETTRTSWCLTESPTIFDKYCTPAVQNGLQQHPEYNEKLKDDPIRTFDAIEILIYNPVRVVYPLEVLTNA